MNAIARWYGEAPWLTRQRLQVYPKLFLIVYVAASVFWILSSNGLIDRSGTPLGADFIDPWSASFLALKGTPWAVYHVSTLWSVERAAVSYQQVGFAGFHYPPTYLLIILPLALLPYGWALIVWTPVTLSGYVAVLRKIDSRWDSLWLALAFPGVLINLTNGQNGFLTVALLGGGLLALDSSPILAGIFFGLLSYKPQYGVLLPIFLIVTRRWRVLAVTCATVVLFIAVSWLAFGTETWRAFFGSLAFTRKVVLENGGSGFDTLQSAFSAARLWGFDIATAYVVQACACVLTVAATIWIWTRTENFALHAAALVIGTLMMSPYMMYYDLVLLALPIAWLALNAEAVGFLPGEKSILAIAWVAPLLARPLAGRLLLPITPLLLVSLIALIIRRVRANLQTERVPQFARDQGLEPG